MLDFLSPLSNHPIARRQVLGAGMGKYHGTPLQSAILAGEPTFTKRFLKEGADIDANDIHGWSPRHCLYLCSHDEIRALVESGLPWKKGPVYNQKSISIFNPEQMKTARTAPTHWSSEYKPEFVHLEYINHEIGRPDSFHCGVFYKAGTGKQTYRHLEYDILVMHLTFCVCRSR